VKLDITLNLWNDILTAFIYSYISVSILLKCNPQLELWLQNRFTCLEAVYNRLKHGKINDRLTIIKA
jgi:hypothetical protein